MSQRIPTGKLPAPLLRELLARAPALPAEVRLGPRLGEDACAIDVEAGTLVAATDPITLTGSGVGAHAVWINANDVAVTGVRPRWFLAALLLPPGTDGDEVRELFAGLHRALARVGAVLVGGHSEVTDAVRQPVVVGQMLGWAERGRIVTSGGTRAGDRLLQVGRAPVEGAALLAGRATGVDAATLRRAAAALESPGISVVEPALACVELGTTALHDPTEGGLAAGLLEMAEAAGLRLRLDDSELLWFEPGLAVCAALGADPWATLASGTLLASFPGERAGSATRALRERGFEAAAIGRAEPGAGVLRADGSELRVPERDEVARLLG